MLLTIINFIPPYVFFLPVASSMFFCPCDFQGPHVARLECYVVSSSSVTIKFDQTCLFCEDWGFD